MLEQKTTLRRRTKPKNTAEFYDDGYLRVEHDNYHLSCGGSHVKLGRAEFLIASYLARRAERYVAAEAIWHHLWNGRKPLNLDSLHVMIYRLRRRLAPLGVNIETMVNVGYKLLPAQMASLR